MESSRRPVARNPSDGEWLTSECNAAYADSADAHFNLADAYLQDGQKGLARQYAEKALAMIDSHAAPLSSWSDTSERRAEIRQGIVDTLKKLSESKP
ncbi:MAG TPA: tetratricopeptide repeat protein [Candidatus Acidoferrum sp.]